MSSSEKYISYSEDKLNTISYNIKISCLWFLFIIVVFVLLGMYDRGDLFDIFTISLIVLIFIIVSIFFYHMFNAISQPHLQEITRSYININDHVLVYNSPRVNKSILINDIIKIELIKITNGEISSLIVHSKEDTIDLYYIDRLEEIYYYLITLNNSLEVNEKYILPIFQNTYRPIFALIIISFPVLILFIYVIVFKG